MNSRGFAAGRVAGIALFVHPTVALTFGLIVLGLANAILPGSAPDADPSAYWFVALVGGLAFFASLLAHETAHALVARRNGVGVRAMSLWLFGGVAELEKEPPTAGAEFRIAAAGPAASLACAASFAAFAIGASIVGIPDVLIALGVWLTGTNVALAVFNLIPGAPLDGGRILKAWLWSRHGDRDKATVSAARSGRFFGLALIGFGIVDVVAGGNSGGLWTAFVGWFLLGAANTEAARALTSKALHGLTVADVMAPAPPTVPGWTTLQRFVDNHLVASRSALFVAIDLDARPVGVVTPRHLSAYPPDSWPSVRIDAVMTQLSSANVVSPADDVLVAYELLAANAADVLVIDASTHPQVVGTVNSTDLSRALERRSLHLGHLGHLGHDQHVGHVDHVGGVGHGDPADRVGSDRERTPTHAR